VVRLIENGSSVFSFSLSPRGEVCGLFGDGELRIGPRHLPVLRDWLAVAAAEHSTLWFCTIRRQSIGRLASWMGFVEIEQRGGVRVFRMCAVEK